MGIRIFKEPQVLEEAIIIEFNLKDLKVEPKVTKKYYYNGKEISKSRFYLIHLDIHKHIAIRTAEIQNKETNNIQGILLTGLNIFKYRIDKNTRDIKFVSQIDIIEYEQIPEIQIDGDVIRVILHKREIYPAIWEFKPIQIDEELENGLKQYLLDAINMAKAFALTKK
ncbi:MAG: hypothetical protein ACO2ON_01555 [Candidatus Nanopusillus sp.]